MQVLMNYLGESIAAHITVTFHDLEGRDVCQITIEPAEHPAYLQDKNESALYLRAGNSTRPLPVHEAVKYVSTRWS